MPESSEQLHESTLVYVDLAGSERVKKSGSTGLRLQEAKEINSGLLALEKVILALERKEKYEKAGNDKKVRGVHIPFLDSSLTKLLRPIFYGDSLVTIICNASGDESDAEETINSMKFCMRCKNIKNPIYNDYKLKIESDRVSKSQERGDTHERRAAYFEQLYLKVSEELNQYKQALSEKERDIVELKSTLEKTLLKEQQLSTQSNNQIINFEELSRKTSQFYCGNIEELHLQNKKEGEVCASILRDMKDKELSDIYADLQNVKMKVRDYELKSSTEREIHDNQRFNKSAIIREESIESQSGFIDLAKFESRSHQESYQPRLDCEDLGTNFKKPSLTPESAMRESKIQFSELQRIIPAYNLSLNQRPQSPQSLNRESTQKEDLRTSQLLRDNTIFQREPEPIVLRENPLQSNVFHSTCPAKEKCSEGIVNDQQPRTYIPSGNWNAFLKDRRLTVRQQTPPKLAKPFPSPSKIHMRDEIKLGVGSCVSDIGY